MSLTLIIGTVIFIAIFIGAAYLITDKVTKEAEDEKTKQEYRK